MSAVIAGVFGWLAHAMAAVLWAAGYTAGKTVRFAVWVRTAVRTGWEDAT